MARLLALDYGGKRTGIAVSDPLQIIATGLTTVHTKDLLSYLKTYTKDEEVERFIIGQPLHADGNPTANEQAIKAFIPKLEKAFPNIPIVRVDERFSSVEAQESMFASGMKKKKRRNKATLDEISATIILQRYMETL